MRLRPSAGIVALSFLVGCGGKAFDPASAITTAQPTGGGGAIADYVGSYTGTYATIPADASASTTAGTVALTITSDGTVTGTRHVAVTGADQNLTGSIDDQGRLSLTRQGQSTTGTLPLNGHLAKESGARAFGVLVEAQDFENSDLGDLWYAYRLSGGSQTAGSDPLTAGKWLVGYRPGRTNLKGSWYATESASGKVNLSVSAAGAVSGTWTLANGTIQQVSGALSDLAGTQARQSFGGTIAVGSQTLQLRLIAPGNGYSFGLVEIVGTASTEDGSVSDALYLTIG